MKVFLYLRFPTCIDATSTVMLRKIFISCVPAKHFFEVSEIMSCTRSLYFHVNFILMQFLKIPNVLLLNTNAFLFKNPHSTSDKFTNSFYQIIRIEPIKHLVSSSENTYGRNSVDRRATQSMAFDCGWLWFCTELLMVSFWSKCLCESHGILSTRW